MQGFQEKVVLVTGGTSGIGRATAVAFAARGAHVVVAGRRQQNGEESVKMIEKSGGKGLFIKADVSREDEIERLVQRTVDRFGRLDIAFNNAGIAGRGFEPFSEVTADSFNEMFAVNVRAVALGMKHEIAAMLKSGGGAIVNNASVAGLRPVPQLSLYSASKSAVISLTKGVAREVATQGICVNAVCPATFETEMSAEALRDPETRKMLVAMHPVGRIGQLEELTAAVLYLCSDAAKFVTGVAFPVDGGFSA